MEAVSFVHRFHLTPPSIPASLNSFPGRSCSVRFIRSTKCRPVVGVLLLMLDKHLLLDSVGFYAPINPLHLGLCRISYM